MNHKEWIEKTKEEFDDKFLIKSIFGQCINDMDGHANERIKDFFISKHNEYLRELAKKIEGMKKEIVRVPGMFTPLQDAKDESYNKALQDIMALLPIEEYEQGN